MDDKATKRYVAAAATHARREVEAKYADQQWTEAVDELNMSAERLQELRVLAQLPYSHPDILRPLLGNARAERTVQKGCWCCGAQRSFRRRPSRSKTVSAKATCLR